MKVICKNFIYRAFNLFKKIRGNPWERPKRDVTFCGKRQNFQEKVCVFRVLKKLLKCGFKICTRENMDSQTNTVRLSFSGDNGPNPLGLSEIMEKARFLPKVSDNTLFNRESWQQTRYTPVTQP